MRAIKQGKTVYLSQKEIEIIRHYLKEIKTTEVQDLREKLRFK